MKSFNKFSEDVKIQDAKGNVSYEVVDIIKPEPIKVVDSPVKWRELTETSTLPKQRGNIVWIRFVWRNRYMYINCFFPQTNKPDKEQVNYSIQKIYPGAKLSYFEVSNYEPGQPLFIDPED